MTRSGAALFRIELTKFSERGDPPVKYRTVCMALNATSPYSPKVRNDNDESVHKFHLSSSSIKIKF